MSNKNFCLWINDEELEILRKKADAEHRSIANFVKNKCGVFKNESPQERKSK